MSLFLWHLSINVFTLIFRVDPKETSDIKRTPMKLAAENNHEEIVEILREAIGEDIPDDVKLQQLSKAMYEDDKEKAKNKFHELLSSLSPELVRFKSYIYELMYVIG